MKQNIDFISDLHMEINGNVAHDLEFPTEYTNVDILVLCGDITCFRYFNPQRTDATSRSMRKRFAHFLTETCKNYAHILYIPGNHEYYNYFIEGADEEFQQRIKMIDRRICVLQNSIFITGEATIFGSTFWTNFQDGPGDPYEYINKKAVENGMNDYNLIHIKDWDKLSYAEQKIGRGSAGSLITADYTQGLHYDSMKKLMHYYDDRHREVPFIVATHHGPSMKSHDHHRFGADALKYGYLSEYDNFIANSEIHTWIHGHTHSNINYEIGNTKITSSMYGYYGYDKPLNSPKQKVGRITL